MTKLLHYSCTHTKKTTTTFFSKFLMNLQLSYNETTQTMDEIVHFTRCSQRVFSLAGRQEFELVVDVNDRNDNVVYDRRGLHVAHAELFHFPLPVELLNGVKGLGFVVVS